MSVAHKYLDLGQLPDQDHRVRDMVRDNVFVAMCRFQNWLGV